MSMHKEDEQKTTKKKRGKNEKKNLNGQFYPYNRSLTYSNGDFFRHNFLNPLETPMSSYIDGSLVQFDINFYKAKNANNSKCQQHVLPSRRADEG